MSACAEMGLGVPRDVAVVGCDDIVFAGLLSPALTTPRVPKYDTGESAARMLLHRIGDRRREDEMLLRPELVVRASAPRMYASEPSQGGVDG